MYGRFQTSSYAVISLSQYIAYVFMHYQIKGELTLILPKSKNYILADRGMGGGAWCPSLKIAYLLYRCCNSTSLKSIMHNLVIFKVATMQNPHKQKKIVQLTMITNFGFPNFKVWKTHTINPCIDYTSILTITSQH